MGKKKKTEPVQQPVVTKKADPADELVEAVDEFLTNMTVVTRRSLKSMLTQFAAKADATIAKLDEATGGSPEPAVAASSNPEPEPPPKKQD